MAADTQSLKNYLWLQNGGLCARPLATLAAARIALGLSEAQWAIVEPSLEV